MLFPPILQANLPHPPLADRPTPNRLVTPDGNKPPRKPDWLLIMVAILFVLTVLIAWWVGIPGRGR